MYHSIIKYTLWNKNMFKVVLFNMMLTPYKRARSCPIRVVNCWKNCNMYELHLDLCTSFSRGWLFRVATFELLVADWGAWGDDLEHLYTSTCILWHGHGRRRLDGMMFASLTFCSPTLIYNIILFYVAIGFVTWLHVNRNWQLYKVYV